MFIVSCLFASIQVFSTSMGMMWVTLNTPSAAEKCRKLSRKCQGISHCLESGHHAKIQYLFTSSVTMAFMQLKQNLLMPAYKEVPATLLIPPGTWVHDKPSPKCHVANTAVECTATYKIHTMHAMCSDKLHKINITIKQLCATYESLNDNL